MVVERGDDAGGRIGGLARNCKAEQHRKACKGDVWERRETTHIPLSVGNTVIAAWKGVRKLPDFLTTCAEHEEAD
jgi:hypothetical protein